MPTAACVFPVLSKEVTTAMAETVSSLYKQNNKDFSKVEEIFMSRIFKVPINPNIMVNLTLRNYAVMERNIQLLHREYNNPVGLNSVPSVVQYKLQLIHNLTFAKLLCENLSRPEVEERRPTTRHDHEMMEDMAVMAPCPDTTKPILLVYGARFDLDPGSKNRVIESGSHCWISLSENSDIKVKLKKSDTLIGHDCSDITVTTEDKEVEYKFTGACRNITIDGVKIK